MKIFLQVFLLIVYYLTFLVPRNRNVWVFGGALDKFIDNAKYAFLYCTQGDCKKKFVWLSKDEVLVTFLREKGFLAYSSRSLRGLFYALTAKVYIYDNVISEFSYAVLSGGAVRINLWHGVPLKKINFDDRRPSKFWDKFFIYHCAPPTYVCTTAHKLVPIFSSAFHIDEKRVFVGGYHRTLPFFCSDEELSRIVKKTSGEEFVMVFETLKKDKRKKVVYMPTFRDSDPYYFSKAIPDLMALDIACRKMDILFIIKVHRFTKVNVKREDFSNIMILEKSWDIYPILPLTDMLVTDYSSIMFDYALLGKPILYYPFDLEKYIAESRKLYFSYDTICDKSCQVFTIEDLIRKMKGLRTQQTQLYPFFDCPKNFSEIFRCVGNG